MSELPALAIAGMARRAPVTAMSAVSHLMPPVGTSPRLPGCARPCGWPLALHVSPVDRCLLLDQRAGELLGIEGPQVLERLADPDQLHRDAELGCDGEGDSALGAPIELG